MPAATIVFLDVVQFSRKPTEEQKRLIEGLNAEVSHELRALLFPPYERPQVVALPTGDGMALAFVHDDPRHWNRETIFRLLLRLQLWSYSYPQRWSLIPGAPGAPYSWPPQSDAKPGSVALRVGMHTGSVEFVTDINGKPNLCGDTINFAQRLMDAANPRQVLLSEAAFREYVGPAINGGDRPFPFFFDKPVSVMAKHGLRLQVYPMQLREAHPFWNNDEPESRNWLTVTLTQISTHRTPFYERVKQSRDVAIVALTGASFLKHASTSGKSVREIFNSELKRLWLFMPEEGLYERLGGSEVAGVKEPLQHYVEEWRRVLRELHREQPDGEFLFGRCRSLGFYAGYLDWTEPNGAIHVYPHVWGMPLGEATGFILTRQDGNASQPYEKYQQGLSNLRNMVQDWEVIDDTPAADSVVSTQKDGFLGAPETR